MTTNDKGHVAELEIALAATRLGVAVLRPMSDHCRADLAFEVGGRLWRVQCKWGRLSVDGASIIVHLGTCSLGSAGYRRTTYTADEVDLLAVYCGDVDRSFLLPVTVVAGKHEVRLRLSPARNGQLACTTLAADYDFPGAIAQLGERVTGSHEVAGSSPASSTDSRPRQPTMVSCHSFRERFGDWIERAAHGEEVIVTRHGKPHVRLTAPVASAA
jgi:prevent-host-death family protein